MSVCSREEVRKRTDAAEVRRVNNSRVAVIDGLPCPDLLNQNGPLVFEALDKS
jgi:hypothetical protein